MVSLLPFFEWMNDTSIGTAIRESTWWYPILEASHAIGTILVVGTISVVDLRLLGLGLKAEPVSEVAGRLLPWTWAGFVFQAVGGSLVMASEASRIYHVAFFWAKMALLLLAGLNALVFHFTIYRNVREWDTAPVTPLRAKVGACISLCLWISIVATGRAIGYA